MINQDSGYMHVGVLKAMFHEPKIGGRGTVWGAPRINSGGDTGSRSQR